MSQFLLIFVGGGLGSVTRFFLGKLVQQRAGTPSGFLIFPIGTLVVNVVASLVLGFFIGMVEARSVSNPAWRALVAVGFCGGFSTFSSFSHDTLSLILGNRFAEASLNILLSVSLCLLATLGGLWLGKLI